MSRKYVNKYIRNLPHSDLERRPIRKYRHPRHTRPACWRASFPAGSGETEGMWRRRRREREGGRRLSPGTQQQCENTLAQQEYNHGSSLLVPTPRGFSTFFSSSSLFFPGFADPGYFQYGSGSGYYYFYSNSMIRLCTHPQVCLFLHIINTYHAYWWYIKRCNKKSYVIIENSDLTWT